eukprot:2405876-Amphidinium_carterae.1
MPTVRQSQRASCTKLGTPNAHPKALCDYEVWGGWRGASVGTCGMHAVWHSGKLQMRQIQVFCGGLWVQGAMMSGPYSLHLWASGANKTVKCLVTIPTLLQSCSRALRRSCVLDLLEEQYLGSKATATTTSYRDAKVTGSIKLYEFLP